MRRNLLNFWIDLATLITLLGMVCTGLVIRFLLPPGSSGRGGGQGLSLWGMSRHDWGTVHFWLSLCLVSLIALHLILHWTWICSTFRRCFVRAEGSAGQLSKKTMNRYGWGFIALIALTVFGFFWVAGTRVETTTGSGDTRGAAVVRGTGLGRRTEAPVGSTRGRQTEEEDNRLGIRGSMTLREVAQHTGIDPNQLKQLLRLPASTLVDERLGRLGRRYGFQLTEVRQIIAAHLRVEHR